MVPVPGRGSLRGGASLLSQADGVAVRRNRIGPRFGVLLVLLLTWGVAAPASLLAADPKGNRQFLSEGKTSTEPGINALAVPSGFTESTAFSGLTNPINVQFAGDGRVFVAEKSGIIKVFDNLTDTTPTTFADLRTNVFSNWDRGLLGMTLAPNFP